MIAQSRPEDRIPEGIRSITLISQNREEAAMLSKMLDILHSGLGGTINAISDGETMTLSVFDPKNN